MTEDTFEPKIIGFLCNWCSYRAADLAGTARMKYEPNVRIIRVMCSGRVDPNFVLKAFAMGADGVMIAGVFALRPGAKRDFLRRDFFPKTGTIQVDKAAGGEFRRLTNLAVIHYLDIALNSSIMLIT